jgi:predicted DCC family thiol-disulfide oxidoreductase YuxK
MKVVIVYDGACPFCSDYVRYQDLRARADSVELVDARIDPQALVRYAIAAADLEDGMVVIVDDTAHRGADAVHALSTLSQTPRNWWVSAVAFASRSAIVSRLLYPFLMLGRRVVLTVLRIPRFSNPERTDRPR